jgi:hypothetical protein
VCSTDPSSLSSCLLNSPLLHSVDDAHHSVSLLRSPYPDERSQGGLGLTDIELQTYPGVGHTYWGGELDDISLWIERVLPMARGEPKLFERDGLRRVRK